MNATDYTDPSTIDVDVVIGEINHAFKTRGKTWTAALSWPNVTIKRATMERIRDTRDADAHTLAVDMLAALYPRAASSQNRNTE